MNRLSPHNLWGTVTRLARWGKVRSGRAGYVEARLARSGKVGYGGVWYGLARFGKAGPVRYGQVWLVEARQGWQIGAETFVSLPVQ